MSLTSYRAAPSRGNLFCLKRRRQHVLPWLSSHKLGRPFGLARAALPFGISDVVNGFFLGAFVICVFARAAMPGDDLLFHRLSDSTIGAVWFHGRVRDGIGWFTDAIATRQWSPCDG